ncbi:hypothetical protein BBI01_04990 [Chryseobacterium artocarpi]|uniref:Uncharacterized protein n=1 Tax=Chryseobacterium artocarpi TaxID=1414727 RepID=A0A1B8ZWT6_9FLAO|nr:hypothetical protein [Chryseobacterium artocarpi]OCA76055.1 hypothetical protein BBI01_04990 [Chryseobacterium artocarpi]
MSIIGKIIRVNELPPVGERETNAIYQVAQPGSPIYTDYAVDQNGDLKTHAVTDGSIPLELADTHLAISSSSFITEGIKNQAQYNIYTRDKLDHKLDMPSIEGNAQNYPKIVGLDDNGKVAKLPAGDLGKNIANSSLTTVPGSGLTLGANWTLGTSGFYYSITGLSDKSADTTFNRMMIQNSSGQVSWSNGKNMISNYPLLLNDAEKETWRNRMKLSTEKFATGTPRIDVLLLPFIDNTKNFIQYTTLVGLNLFVDNVSPNAYIKVKRIKDIHGTNLSTPEEYNVDNFTVMQNFPNNLNFGINWSTKPEGYYQIFVTHNGLTNPSSPELIVKAGITYSQFTGIANWTSLTGNTTIADTSISLSMGSSAQSANLISIADINAGFMVSFSANNNQTNYGANFVGYFQGGIIGDDGVFYGFELKDKDGSWKISRGESLPIKNETFHIAYYNGIVYIIAESNGKTYQQFNSSFNLYPKRFYISRGTGGQGTLSMNLLGKILLS